jgi:hypothetical protein
VTCPTLVLTYNKHKEESDIRLPSKPLHTPETMDYRVPTSHLDMRVQKENPSNSFQGKSVYQ